MDDWNSPIYAFFHPIPTIGYKDGRRYHEFHCFASTCSKSVHQFLDKKDAGSTSNLHKHAKICWGLDTVKAAMEHRMPLKLNKFFRSLKMVQLLQLFR